MSKISHIIKTKSLNSDGRLIKWIESLDNTFESEIFILEDNNSTNIYENEKYRVINTSLISRKFFKKRKGYIFKVPEFTLKCLLYIFRCDSKIILFHDMQHYLTLFVLVFFKKIGFKKRILWDLHELPHQIFFNFYFFKKILEFILSSIDILIYTNDERREYMLSKLNYKENNFFILNNYPDNSYISDKKREFPPELINLRRNKPYILWLGIASRGRNFHTFLSAFKNIDSRFNLVMLGSVDSEFKTDIENYIKRGIVYNNFVPQNKIIDFIDSAFFSVVLYNQNTPNNKYCEPNRLYQLICRNIPIIVGSNPTMKNLVDKKSCGIVLKDDGSDINDLFDSINLLVDNIDFYKQNLLSLNKDVFSWNNQFNIINNNLSNI